MWKQAKRTHVWSAEKSNPLNILKTAAGLSPQRSVSFNFILSFSQNRKQKTFLFYAQPRFIQPLSVNNHIGCH